MVSQSSWERELEHCGGGKRHLCVDKSLIGEEHNGPHQLTGLTYCENTYLWYNPQADPARCLSKL